MTTTALIRPAWTPATIGLMVLGFMVFWPLGLTMLAYILWGDRFEGFKRGFRSEFRGAKEGFFGACRGRHARHYGPGRTGNVAFDEWREKELERLEEERRKLDEEARDFRNFVEELKRAKDREEFDAYMAKRRSAGNGTANA